MRHPPLDAEDDDEVTGVTHEIQQLAADAEACRKAAARVVRASDSIVKSLTPSTPMPAVHRHVRECWASYSHCADDRHRHDYDCGTGELSPRCPSYRQ